MNRSLLIAGVLALGAVGWIVSGQIDSSASQQPIQKAAAPVPADDAGPTVRVRRLEAEPHAVTVALRGATEAVRSVDLKVETGGRIAEILAPLGQVVEAGEPLLRLAEDERVVRVKEAEALLAQRRIEHQAATKLAQKGYRSETELAAAEAALQAAQAALEVARLDLEKTTLVAPFRGIVESHLMKAGDFADRGEAVLRLVQFDPLLVVAHADEREVLKLATDMEGRARLTDGRELEGKLRFVSSQGEAGTRTFRVELSVANAERTIPAGVTADLIVPLEPVMAYKISPAMLTLDVEGRLGVKVLDDSGTVVFLPVEVLDDESDGIWLSGLPPALTLITVGQEFVAPGTKVRAVEERTIQRSGDQT